MKILTLLLLQSFFSVESMRKKNREANENSQALLQDEISREEEAIEDSFGKFNEALKSCKKCLKNACNRCKKLERIDCAVCSVDACISCKKKYHALQDPSKELSPKLELIKDQIDRLEGVAKGITELKEKIDINQKISRTKSRLTEAKSKLEIYILNNKKIELSKDTRYKTRMRIAHLIYILSSSGIIILTATNMMKETFNISYMLCILFLMMILNHFFYHLKTRLEMKLEKYWDKNFSPEHELPKGLKPAYKTTRWNFEFYIIMFIPFINILLDLVSFIPVWREDIGLTDCSVINGTKDCEFNFSSLGIVFLNIIMIIFTLFKRLSYQKTELDDLK